VNALSPAAPLARAIGEEALALVDDGAAPEVVLEPPAKAEHGDLASPVALALARRARRAPRDLAEALADGLRGRGDVAPLLERVDVAGPGFVNLVLAPAWFAEAAGRMAEAGEAYGAGQADPRERILLEFVSANPTGALHVGHARHAAYGDSLGRVLEFAGHEVTREFYVNDYGRQIALFGASVAARYGELLGVPTEMPEDGYRGDEVRDLAARVRDAVGDRYRDRVSPPSPAVELELARIAGDLVLDDMRADLERLRVRFDAYFHESVLQDAGRVAGGIETLRASGDAYVHNGAVWFRTTSYGDEKDRVLVRGDGAMTYLAADVAYHLDKAGRDYERLIDVLGADHHGYVARLRAVLAAGGHDPDRLEVPILQLVSLLERGEARRMSKRAGTLVPFRELLDDIGVDAARFFLVQAAHETALDLDLELAREASQKNPVYYVQYAHARVAGILGQLDAEPAPAGPPATLDPSERALTLRLSEWPQAVREAEERRAPHRIAAHLIDTARDFHAFYTRCRVVGEPPETLAFRVDLCRTTGNVVRTGLGLLGVEAPDRM
jgi:arginyl-tRNA synthetase